MKLKNTFQRLAKKAVLPKQKGKFMLQKLMGGKADGLKNTPWNKGKKETRPEILKKQSESHLGKIPWNKGKKFSNFGEGFDNKKYLCLWRKNNLEKMKNYRSTWNKNNPEKQKQGRNLWRRDKERALESHRKYTYGITSEQIKNFLIKQNNSCAICNIFFKENKFEVDHCHHSLIVRGLLCRKCNMGLGFFNDNPERIKKAFTYLETCKTV